MLKMSELRHQSVVNLVAKYTIKFDEINRKIGINRNGMTCEYSFELHPEYEEPYKEFDAKVAALERRFGGFNRLEKMILNQFNDYLEPFGGQTPWWDDET